MSPFYKHRPSLPIWLGLLSIGVLVGIAGVLNVLRNNFV